jgi:hypothetical protein
MTAQGDAPSGNNKGFLTEHKEEFNFSGYAGFTIAVSANDMLNFSFTSDDATALTPVNNFTNTNLQGLGIYFDSSQSGSLQQVLPGCDDQTINDDNDFEAMLVRADFRPASVVPLPAAVWLFGGGLLGLIGIARRKKAWAKKTIYNGSFRGRFLLGCTSGVAPQPKYKCRMGTSGIGFSCIRRWYGVLGSEA